MVKKAIVAGLAAFAVIEAICFAISVNKKSLDSPIPKVGCVMVLTADMSSPRFDWLVVYTQGSCHTKPLGETGLSEIIGGKIYILDSKGL